MKVLFFDSVAIGFGYLTGAVVILAWVVYGLRDDGLSGKTEEDGEPFV